MLPSTQEVLQRVKKLVAEKRPWFDAISEWYQKTKLPRRLIVDILDNDRGRERIVVLVNNEALEGVSQVSDSRGRRLTWLLPSNRLRQGNNNVVVQLAEDASCPLVLRAASLEQDYHVPWQTLKLARPQPAPAPNLALAGAKRASHTGKHWSIEPGGALQFNLAVVHAGPVNFTLHLGAGRASLWLKLVRDAWDEVREEVRDAVKEKLWQLQEKAEEAWRTRDPQGHTMLQDDLQALSAYLRLDRLQLAPAFEGPPDITLEEIIAQTGNPDTLTRDLLAPAQNVPPEVRPVLAPDQPPMVIPVRRPPPAAQAKSAAAGTAQRAGGCGCLVAILLIAGVIAGGYFAWQDAAVQAWVRQTFAAAGKTTASETKKGKAADDAPEAMAELLRVQKAGTGDVQISLFWFNKNDLDLHVTCPSGEEISFRNRNSRCGGKLDIDQNVGYATATKQAVENVYWAKGKAPKGLYNVYVEFFNNFDAAPDCPNPCVYKVRLVVRGQERFFDGQIAYNAGPQKNKVLVHQFTLD